MNFWKMNHKDYAENWRDVIRPLILKRDNYKCRECGVLHRSRVYKSTAGSYVVCDEFIEAWAKEQGKKVFTLYLQVAHIDNDKTNNEPSNLITLCPVHHAKMDSDYKKLKRLIFRSKTTENKISNKVQPSQRSCINLFEIKQLINEFTGVKLPVSDVKIIVDKILSYGTSID